MKFLKTLLLSMTLAVSSYANAGLIQGTGDIESRTVEYIQFMVSGMGSFTFDLKGTPYVIPNEPDENPKFESYEFYLFKGHFGAFESGFIFSTNTNGVEDTVFNRIYESDILNAGKYTFAVGVHQLDETEARIGVASTPKDQTLSFDYKLFGAHVVPEPTTLAIFALGLIGLTARRMKKQ